MGRDRNQEQSAIQNIIAKNTVIKGDFSSEGDIRIDGTIEGNVSTTGKVVVGRSGRVEGTLTSSNAYFEGFFQGTLAVTGTLTLKETAHIEGEVTTAKLAVEPGATFNVSCEMKSSTKAISGASKSQKSA